MDTEHGSTSATDKLNGEISSLKGKLEGIFDSLMKNKDMAIDKAKDTLDKTSTKVREQPIMAMLIMLFVGVIVGRIFAAIRRA